LFANGFHDLTDAFFSPATYGYPPPPYFLGGGSDTGATAGDFTPGAGGR